MEDETTSQCPEVRRIRRESPQFEDAVCAAMDVRTDAGGRSGIRALLRDSDRDLVIDPVYGVFDGDRLVVACIAIESPGHAALICAPWSELSPRCVGAITQTLGLAVEVLAERGVRLVEVLLPEACSDATSLLRASGFRHLTQLIYLRRRLEPTSPVSSVGIATDLEWCTFAPSREPLFTRALELSYRASLDCPELGAVRRKQDVLAGHKAVGAFDPSYWFVASRGDEPAGVLLLSRIIGQPVAEIVYMGVAQPSRGTGVGNALIAQAIEAAGRLGVSSLALAVDKRNAPARRVYARWGFVETGRRDAWIATPAETIA